MRPGCVEKRAGQRGRQALVCLSLQWDPLWVLEDRSHVRPADLAAGWLERGGLEGGLHPRSEKEVEPEGQTGHPSTRGCAGRCWGAGRRERAAACCLPNSDALRDHSEKPTGARRPLLTLGSRTRLAEMVLATVPWVGQSWEDRQDRRTCGEVTAEGAGHPRDGSRGAGNREEPGGEGRSPAGCRASGGGTEGGASSSQRLVCRAGKGLQCSGLSRTRPFSLPCRLQPRKPVPS